jgi:hypothetical protein
MVTVSALWLVCMCSVPPGNRDWFLRNPRNQHARPSGTAAADPASADMADAPRVSRSPGTAGLAGERGAGLWPKTSVGAAAPSARPTAPDRGDSHRQRTAAPGEGLSSPDRHTPEVEVRARRLAIASARGRLRDRRSGRQCRRGGRLALLDGRCAPGATRCLNAAAETPPITWGRRLMSRRPSVPRGRADEMGAAPGAVCKPARRTRGGRHVSSP